MAQTEERDLVRDINRLKATRMKNDGTKDRFMDNVRSAADDTRRADMRKKADRVMEGYRGKTKATKRGGKRKSGRKGSKR